MGARKAGGWVAGKLLDYAKAKAAGTSKVTWNCCGGTGKHVGGCDGEIHDDFKGASHSGQYLMTADQMRKLKAQGGSFRSATPDGKGKFLVNVSKWPKNWEH